MAEFGSEGQARSASRRIPGSASLGSIPGMGGTNQPGVVVNVGLNSQQFFTDVQALEQWVNQNASTLGIVVPFVLDTSQALGAVQQVQQIAQQVQQAAQQINAAQQSVTGSRAQQILQGTPRSVSALATTQAYTDTYQQQITRAAPAFQQVDAAITTQTNRIKGLASESKLAADSIMGMRRVFTDLANTPPLRIDNATDQVTRLAGVMDRLSNMRTALPQGEVFDPIRTQAQQTIDRLQAAQNIAKTYAEPVDRALSPRGTSGLRADFQQEIGQAALVGNQTEQTAAALVRERTQSVRGAREEIAAQEQIIRNVNTTAESMAIVAARRAQSRDIMREEAAAEYQANQARLGAAQNLAPLAQGGIRPRAGTATDAELQQSLALGAQRSLAQGAIQSASLQSQATASVTHQMEQTIEQLRYAQRSVGELNRAGLGFGGAQPVVAGALDQRLGVQNAPLATNAEAMAQAQREINTLINLGVSETEAWTAVQLRLNAAVEQQAILLRQVDAANVAGMSTAQARNVAQASQLSVINPQGPLGSRTSTDSSAAALAERELAVATTTYRQSAVAAAEAQVRLTIAEREGSVESQAAARADLARAANTRELSAALMSRAAATRTAALQPAAAATPIPVGQQDFQAVSGQITAAARSAVQPGIFERVTTGIQTGFAGATQAVKTFAGSIVSTTPAVNASAAASRGAATAEQAQAAAAVQAAAATRQMGAAHENAAIQQRSFASQMLYTVNLMVRYTLVGAVFQAVGQAISGTIHVTSQAIEAQFELAKAVRGSADAYKASSDQIADASATSRAETLTATANLARLRNEYALSDEQIKNLIQASADLARVNGTDVVTAAHAVELAIHGNSRTLENYGITISSRALKELGALDEAEAKQLSKLGSTQLAQIRYNEIIKQASAYHGAAADYADRQAGAYGRLATAMSNLAESIGTGLAPAVSGIEDRLAGMVKLLQEAIDKDKQRSASMTAQQSRDYGAGIPEQYRGVNVTPTPPEQATPYQRFNRWYGGLFGEDPNKPQYIPPAGSNLPTMGGGAGVGDLEHPMANPPSFRWEDTWWYKLLFSSTPPSDAPQQVRDASGGPRADETISDYQTRRVGEMSPEDRQAYLDRQRFIYGAQVAPRTPGTPENPQGIRMQYPGGFSELGSQEDFNRAAAASKPPPYSTEDDQAIKRIEDAEKKARDPETIARQTSQAVIGAYRLEAKARDNSLTDQRKAAEATYKAIQDEAQATQRVASRAADDTRDAANRALDGQQRISQNHRITEDRAIQDSRTREDAATKASQNERTRALDAAHAARMDQIDAETKAIREQAQHEIDAVALAARAEDRAYQARIKGLEDEGRALDRNAAAREKSIQAELKLIDQQEQARSDQRQDEQAQRAVRDAQDELTKVKHESVQQKQRDPIRGSGGQVAGGGDEINQHKDAVKKAQEALDDARRSITDEAHDRDVRAKRAGLQGELDSVHTQQQARQQALQDERTALEAEHTARTQSYQDERTQIEANRDAQLEALNGVKDAEQVRFTEKKNALQDTFTAEEAIIARTRELEDRALQNARAAEDERYADLRKQIADTYQFESESAQTAYQNKLSAAQAVHDQVLAFLDEEKRKSDELLQKQIEDTQQKLQDFLNAITQMTPTVLAGTFIGSHPEQFPNNNVPVSGERPATTTTQAISQEQDHQAAQAYATAHTQGGDAAAGYAQGMRDAIPLVGDSIAALIAYAVQSTQAAQQSHSPSQVFAKLGKDASGGYQQGIQLGKDGVVDAAGDLARSAGQATRDVSRDEVGADLVDRLHAGMGYRPGTPAWQTGFTDIPQDMSLPDVRAWVQKLIDSPAWLANARGVTEHQRQIGNPADLTDAERQARQEQTHKQVAATNTFATATGTFSKSVAQFGGAVAATTPAAGGGDRVLTPAEYAQLAGGHGDGVSTFKLTAEGGAGANDARFQAVRAAMSASYGDPRGGLLPSLEYTSQDRVWRMGKDGILRPSVGGANYVEPTYLPPPSHPVQGRASGGSVVQGQDYLIGEYGPERLSMGRGGGSGYVTPLPPGVRPDASTLGGGGRTTIQGPLIGEMHVRNDDDRETIIRSITHMVDMLDTGHRGIVGSGQPMSGR